MKNIVFINVEEIYPHPNNPRRELGDLTELSDSIKANGIFQNLTVVKGHRMTRSEWIKMNSDNPSGSSTHLPLHKGGKEGALEAIGTYEEVYLEDGYTAIIGHRRLAAAKKAGLTEVPCVIADMDEKTQVATMLLENMQRSDLTLLEQAEGFQLMLDFGDSVETVAEKTGFSESTVRRRVKLLNFDRDKLKKSMERQVSLDDYLKLDKISNEDERNKLLECIGTKDFEWKFNNAMDRQKDEKEKQKVQAHLEKFAVQCDDVSDMVYVAYVSDAEYEIPKDADEVKYFFKHSWGKHYYLYRERTEKDKLAEQARQNSRSAADNERAERISVLDDLARRAYESRFEFIKNFKDHKKYKAEIMKFAVCVFMDGITGYDFDECAFGEFSEGLIDTDKILRQSQDDPSQSAELTAPPEGSQGVFGDVLPEKVLLWSAYCAVCDEASDNYRDYYGDYEDNAGLQTSKAYSGSVPVKDSGEYSKRKLPSYSLASFFTSFAPSTAICLISSLDFLNTCSRCATLVEL